jgi:hypothetical protein
MSKTSSTSTGETKQDDTQLHYLGKKLIHPCKTKEEFTSTDLGRWTAIFSYLHFNEYERVSVRILCRLFHTVLPPLSGIYTIFPHPTYPNMDLRSLMNHLTDMTRAGSTNVPAFMFIADGVHDEGGETVSINIPISIIGESREHCIVMGGLFMNGKKEDDVNISNLTLRESKGDGVHGCNASIHLDNVNVEKSGRSGIKINGSKYSTMKNCQVSHSLGCGLLVYGSGLVTVDGSATAIHHNCKGGTFGYGLYTISSSIHLVSLLTKEMVSFDNGSGGNFSKNGTIETIENGEFFQRILQLYQISKEAR